WRCCCYPPPGRCSRPWSTVWSTSPASRSTASTSATTSSSSGRSWVLVARGLPACGLLACGLPACAGRLGERGADQRGQRIQIERPVVAPAVGEEGGRTRHAALVGALHVLGDPRGVAALVQLHGELLDIQAELFGVPCQVLHGQRVLMLEQQVV